MQHIRQTGKTPREPGTENPLSAAIALRDSGTIDTVRRAIEQRHVMLAYQPVASVTQPGQPAFHEGLVRLLDETGRVIPARDFIETIEPTELGRIVDCLALEMGLAALRQSHDLRLSINMSARSIAYPRWNQVLRRGLRGNRGIGERLILEITESSAMIMPDAVTVFMKTLQAEGISFALDDFGAGYTSFRYLRDFYFDMIKIDGQFIRGIARNPDNQCLTAALISIARQFDMFAVAESVETAEDAAWLAQAGVDCLQGYFVGAPTVTPPWTVAQPKLRA